MQQAAKTKIIRARMKAVAYLRFGGPDQLYRRMPQAVRTVALGVQRGELSQELAQAMARELGDAWPFVAGVVDTLTERAA